MTSRTYADYFRDIYEASASAQRFIEGLDFDEFSANQEKVYAVTRALEIIGEAARSVPGDVQLQYPAVPWREMIAMRNIVVHQYFGVDLQVLWRTVREDLPPLQAKMARILYGQDGN